jgi:uncharacterized HhH-GPD family protein
MQKKLPLKPITGSETANAFLFGLILNQNQQADRAWRAPYLLKKRLGTLDARRLARVSPEKFMQAFIMHPALHPFAFAMVRYLQGACEQLVSRYDGDARNIWPNGSTIGDVLKKLREFPGIGPHKATVGVFLLQQELGIPLREDGTSINIQSACPRLYQRYQDKL